MMTLRALKHGHWPVFLVSILSALSNLFLPIILVRLLSPHDIGIYKIFFLYAHSITYLSLAGGPLYSVYYWVGKKENSRESIEQAWLLSLILSIGSALIGVFFSWQIAHMISLSEEQTILLLLSAITAAPGSFLGEYLIAKGKGISGSLFNGGFEILKALLIVGLVYFYRHIDVAFWGFTILFVLKVIIAVVLGKKENIFSLRINRSRIAAVWKYCAPLSLAGALGFFLERVDMLLLSSQLSTDQFAFYSMGCLLVPPLYLLEMSVSKVLIPRLSTAFHHDHFSEMVFAYRKAQKDIAYLMIPAVFGLIIFSRPIIEILFTKTYIESARYLQFYALTYLAFIIPHDAVARATGDSKWVLKIYLLITPLSIAIVYFFTGVFGPLGALISSMAFMFAPKIPGLFFSARVMKHSVLSIINFRDLSFFTAVNCILALTCYGLKPIFKTEQMWFLVLAPLYALVYIRFIQLIKVFKPVELMETNYEV